MFGGNFMIVSHRCRYFEWLQFSQFRIIWLHTCVMVGWLVVLRIYVSSVVFQPYCDLEAGDNQSLNIQVARPGIEPLGHRCSPVSWCNFCMGKFPWQMHNHKKTQNLPQYKNYCVYSIINIINVLNFNLITTPSSGASDISENLVSYSPRYAVSQFNFKPPCLEPPGH